ncbi:MAG: thymidine phosphorylase family protein [Pseudomonadota bacterium]
MNASTPALRARRLGIHTHDEAEAYMRADCHVCRAEGFAQHSRILLESGGREIIATLHHVTSDLLGPDEVGLSEIAWTRLGVHESDAVHASHVRPVESLGSVRRRIYGHRLEPSSFLPIIRDIVEGRYADVHLAAFITACAALPLDREETIALTRAMVDAGERLTWAGSPILDKHSVGGLPGNRTTPIVVAIVAAHGLIMPKTSSRAITSPAGTADTMETLAPVDLDLPAIRRVIELEGGCIVWGGAVRLSPADDVLIRVERALDVDSEGQLVASVLSKKIAAGSNHVVIDMPVGPTAKVRSMEAADALSARLIEVGIALGMEARVIVSDGTQPVGRGIGPALEAHDVLGVLQARGDACADLQQRACALAGALLELAGKAGPGDGASVAAATIADGRAWKKFQAICEAQGGMRVPPVAAHIRPLQAPRAGQVTAIDNRKIARLAKLAGAPESKAAGVALDVKLGTSVAAGQPLCVVHAESRGELHYALDYAAANPDIIQVAVS